MVLEHQGFYETQSAAVSAIVPKIGCIAATLRVCVRRVERNSRPRAGATIPKRDKSKELEREVRKHRPANEIPRMVQAYFAQALSQFAGKPRQGSGNATTRLSHDRVY
jgi:transposase